MKSEVLSGPPTPLRPISTRPATAERTDEGASSAVAAESTKNTVYNECDGVSTPLGKTPTALSLPPPPATHVSDLGDDLLREVLSRTGVLDRAVTARMVCRGWRAALTPPKSAAATPNAVDAAAASPSATNKSKRGKGLSADVDVTTEPRLLCRLDADLLLRLLWLSSWGGDPRAADVPSWNSSFPWLRSLDLRGAGWRPTAAHRAPSLRRVLASCPRLERVRATSLSVLVPSSGAAEASSGDSGGSGAADGWLSGGGRADASSAVDLFFDAAEAQLLAAASMHHGSVTEIELDVSVRLSAEDAEEPPPGADGEEEESGARTSTAGSPDDGGVGATATTPMETDGGRTGEGGRLPVPSSSPFVPSLPPLRLLPPSAIAADPSAAFNRSVDVAETVLAGGTPLKVRRLSLSTPPSSAAAGGGASSGVAEKRCLRLGRAAALGGELRTLTLDRLTPEEAAAAVTGALSAPLSSPPSSEGRSGGGGSQLRRIEFRGVGGGAPCCWSRGMGKALARAFSSSSPLSIPLREIVFEGDAGGATDEERRAVEASVRAAAGGRDEKLLTVSFVEESPARRASGAAYAARAAAAAAAAEARARAAHAADARDAAASLSPPALPAAVRV